ncbi:putative NinC recombination protein [Vibrio phage vB_VchM-138]|uniref:phosphoadenosine phosphosulfate reductase n=1 Tax=Vibrio phage vB_VchM-138 TaxID=1127518 RepID=UPI0002536DF9|nr:phosphoadenosine phosphosulfate reductase [Vibrio phage vB_VchM-138]AFC22689.1 putative NinC recombination protein [Vibrio phage vB_VchM-138]
MQIVANFSGGRSSATAVIKAIEIFGPHNVHVITMDTGAEHPKTYEFMRKFHVFLLTTYGVNITFVRGDFNQPLNTAHKYKVINPIQLQYDLGPYREMCNKYGTPTVASAWCTSRMKEEVHDKYCDDVYGKNNYVTILGIRADEPQRYLGQRLYSMLRNIVNDTDYDYSYILSSIIHDGPASLKWWFPFLNPKRDSELFKAARLLQHKISTNRLMFMAEYCSYDKGDVLRFWGNMDFDLEIPEWLGNCVFCFKKSDLKLAAAVHDEPDLYLEWFEMVRLSPDRKHRTLDQVIALFDGSTGDDLKSRIKGSKMLDTGSCSESCEVKVND